MLKVFNFIHPILHASMVLRGGREIIINPTVGCFSILQLAESRYHNSSNKGIWTREVISSR